MSIFGQIYGLSGTLSLLFHPLYLFRSLHILGVRVRGYATFCSALRLYLSPALQSHLGNISSKVFLILGLHFLLYAFSISYHYCVILGHKN